MGSRLLAALSAAILTSSCAFAAAQPPARIFSQIGMSVGPDGQNLPPTVLDPDRRDDLEDLRFDLGRGRILVLRTNLPAARRDDAAEVAAVVRRCHDFVEEQSGRQVRGDMLLYILSFPVVPRAYTFRVEVDAPDRWSQVRLALLSDDESLTGARASLNLKRLLYGTLPHELGHGLIAERPTVHHDIDGRPSYFTRWFTEGVCETLALRFAQQECPAHAQRILRDRRVDRVLDSADMRSRLLNWAQSDRLAWELESDLYGGALLLVSQWLQAVPLAQLLAQLAGSDAPHDGASLVGHLCRATDSTLEQVLDGASRTGRQLLAPTTTLR